MGSSRVATQLAVRKKITTKFPAMDELRRECPFGKNNNVYLSDRQIAARMAKRKKNKDLFRDVFDIAVQKVNT